VVETVPVRNSRDREGWAAVVGAAVVVAREQETVPAEAGQQGLVVAWGSDASRMRTVSE